MVLFLPCNKTIDASNIVELFFQLVWCHFVLPLTLVFDCDSQFLSHFWKTSCYQLRFSTSFHPQTNRQIEMANCSLVHALCIYHQDNKQWDTYLHVLQLSYDRAIHISIGHCPFEVCHGYQPLAPHEISVALPIASSTHQQKEESKASTLVQNLAKVHAQVHDTLLKTRAKYKQLHDRHDLSSHFLSGHKVWLYLINNFMIGIISLHIFQSGDKVWLYQIHTFQSQQHYKLKTIWYGCYTILRQKLEKMPSGWIFPISMVIDDVMNVS